MMLSTIALTSRFQVDAGVTGPGLMCGANIAGSAPNLGGPSRALLFGGLEIDDAALIRFYTLHVIALPLLAAIFMSVHFWRIRRDGGLARPL